ncbi:recombinase-like helix-turn-helix domain-containing protein (plasmid) [Marinovum sp. KMM 9989]
MDAFKDRLAQRAADTSRPALGHQCRGRALEPQETAFAKVLMEVYAEVGHDYNAVAEALAGRGFKAPISGRSDWTAALVHEELATINASLDAAYAEQGYGA